MVLPSVRIHYEQQPNRCPGYRTTGTLFCYAQHTNLVDIFRAKLLEWCNETHRPTVTGRDLSGA
jgi:hypothetical protein